MSQTRIDTVAEIVSQPPAMTLTAQGGGREDVVHVHWTDFVSAEVGDKWTVQCSGQVAGQSVIAEVTHKTGSLIVIVETTETWSDNYCDLVRVLRHFAIDGRTAIAMVGGE